MRVKTVNLKSGKATPVEFETPASKWLVKNFTSADIYVSFDANFKNENAIKIPSNFAQVIVDNEILLTACRHSVIYIKGTGNVEVQQLCFQ